MDDLLKEAIADAKAVRETALANAKIALEEAFTPRLQSMLSKKIQSEIDVEEQDDEMEDEEEDEEDELDMEPDTETKMYRDDDEGDEFSDEEPEVDMDDEEDEDEIPAEGFDESEVIEINGVKYAPIVSEDDEEEDEEDMGREPEVDDLDLEAILRELEPDEEVEEAHEPGHDEDEDEDDDEKEDVDEEVDQSSGIGSSDNKKGATDKSSTIGSKGKAKHESVEITEGDDDSKDTLDTSKVGGAENSAPSPEASDSSDVGQGSEEPAAASSSPEGEENDDDEVVDDLTEEDDIDLEEVIRALSEEEDEEEEANEVAKIKADLDEHRNVVKYLRSKLNEVNLLNAKLLFTNKLFRSFGLSNDQKMKVVENFDRAHNLREVKLVYSTLAESFGTKTTKQEIKVHKGSASKAVASTKSKKQEIIAEGSELRDRFKKLAGIV